MRQWRRGWHRAGAVETAATKAKAPPTARGFAYGLQRRSPRHGVRARPARAGEAPFGDASAAPETGLMAFPAAGFSPRRLARGCLPAAACVRLLARGGLRAAACARRLA